MGAIEYDGAAAETFSANHPAARVWAEDIRKVRPTEVKRALGRVDVILGGPMCQGVSQRGPRDPHDRRNFAFWAFAEYVRELQPDFFVMENVPALASDVHNRHVAIAVFEELESLGYLLNAEVLNAAWFGVPQLRYRLVVLGARDHRPMFPEAVGHGVTGAFEEDAFVTVGDAITDLPLVEAGGGVDEGPMPGPVSGITQFASQMRAGATILHNHWSADTDEVNLARIRHVSEGGNWHEIPLDLLPSRFRQVRLTDHTTTYRRLDRQHPAHTITTECGNVTSGAFTHPTQNRAITVREAARLQAFPDHFRFVGPRSSQYRQVGNAVPALMARDIAEVLVEGATELPGYVGRITLDALRAHPNSRLPFILAPRYRALFGKTVHRRRRDLVA